MNNLEKNLMDFSASGRNKFFEYLIDKDFGVNAFEFKTNWFYCWFNLYDKLTKEMECRTCIVQIFKDEIYSTDIKDGFGNIYD